MDFEDIDLPPGDPLPLSLENRAHDEEICPYCHDLLRGEHTDCDSCGTSYHSDCWEELGGCATLGCARMATGHQRCYLCGLQMQLQDIALFCDHCQTPYHRRCRMLRAQCRVPRCAGRTEFAHRARKGGEGGMRINVNRRCARYQCEKRVPSEGFTYCLEHAAEFLRQVSPDQVGRPRRECTDFDCKHGVRRCKRHALEYLRSRQPIAALSVLLSVIAVLLLEMYIDARFADWVCLSPLFMVAGAIGVVDWIRCHRGIKEQQEALDLEFAQAAEVRDELPEFLLALTSLDERVAKEAAIGLIQMGEPAVSGLAGCLGHERDAVRIRAIFCLGRLGSKIPSAVPPLVDMLRAGHPMAPAALAQVGDEALPALDELWEENAEGMREQVIQVLRRIETVSSWDVLKKIAAQEEDARSRRLATEALRA